MKIAFTGHRPNKLGGYDIRTNKFNWFNQVLYQYLETIERLNIEFITGMALGVDQWAALYAMENSIPYHAYIPFIGQESAWPAESQNTYKFILADANSQKIVCDGGYAAWKMQKRNEAMVDDCDILFVVWDGTDGGTANCVRYAMKIGKPFHRENPNV